MDNLKAEYKKAIESDKMYVLINLNIKTTVISIMYMVLSMLNTFCLK